MYISIIDYMDALRDYLEAALNDHGIASKHDGGMESAAFDAAARVYAYTVPATDLKGDYPAHCPAVVLRHDGQDGTMHTLALAICVAYPSTSEAEKAHPVPGADGYYTFDATAAGYETGSDVALVRTSIQYTEKVLSALMNFKMFSIENVTVEHTSPAVEEFPFAISTITFDVNANRANIGHDPYIDLY